MNNTEAELIRLIEALVWDPHTSDIEKTHSVQGLLYSWGAMQDHKTDSLFGDDDAHINSPNFRRM